MKPHNKKVTDAQVAEAYSVTGSVWAAADKLGVSGQTVSRRLKLAGVPVNKQWLTEQDRQAIRDYYAGTPSETFDLQVIADKLGRTRHLICREARALGLTNQKREASSETRAKSSRIMAAMWERGDLDKHREAIIEGIKRRPHPRGFLGGKHSPEARAKISEASRRNWATVKTFYPEKVEAFKDNLARIRSLSPTPAENAYSRCNRGMREDIGIYVRSAWEANYARYLNLLVKLGTST